ncbi:MAG: nucleotidyl transferase AbiEii/AbiGii toxin family protein [Lachnospiraceae bacterium]|nr:nucleotidyl transferase AbiEii/AbiGii toxin family protein [Lachnospiraceae bacterium]
MFLHNDKELFQEVIVSAAEDLDLVVPIVEKDYYVTMILKKLSIWCPECVFKGGTSLSKCHHVIDRFSEDIDISFSDKLTQGMRKKLKNETIAGISEELSLPIIDWENARSRRDYNAYTFSYDPIEGYVSEGRLIHGVKMEVSLASLSFPTVELPVESYVYQYLMKENEDIVDEYDLHPFTMKVQDIDRTLADKVFAICDYYLQGKTKRYSRHIYDIYMLLPKVELDEEFKDLVKQVRAVRAKMSICPSAAGGVNVPAVLLEIIDKEVYKDDYASITAYFQKEPVSYNDAIKAVKFVAESGVFAESII